MNVRVLSLTLILILLATIAAAQTRRIAHRSHSGSPTTFAMYMDEDHLGNPQKSFQPLLKLPVYAVDPFIARIRKHYEAVAKQIPVQETAPQAESPKPSGASDSTKSSNDSDTAPASPKTPKWQRSPQAGTPQAIVIPAPDFLVKARPKPAAPALDANRAAQNGLWVLLGLLAVTVAPAVFFVTLILGRRAASGRAEKASAAGLDWVA